MKNYFSVTLLVLVLACTSCNKVNVPGIEEVQGYNMLLIGNSFFDPYAKKIEELTTGAGIVNHNQTRVFRGGVQGTPLQLWNNTVTYEEIKESLDSGNVDIFGMTSGPLPANPVDGYREWIAYAIQSNPDITIFISIVPFDFPNSWEQRAQDYGFSTVQDAYAYYVNEIIHKTVIDSLRAEFPSTNIFSIPTGLASIDLWQMHKDNILLDSISFTGPAERSLFVDTKGHQGDMITITGTLMWLKGLYNIDLLTNDFDTGFNTNLHMVAEDAMNSHDSNYNK